METNPTKGEKKILLQFERFVETDIFKGEVRRVRSLCKLPENGIEPAEEDIKNLWDIFRVPVDFPVKKRKTEHPLRRLNIETRKIIDLLPVNNIYLSSLIRYYVIFNRFFYEELKGNIDYLHKTNVCELENAQAEFDEYTPTSEIREPFDLSMAYIKMIERKLWHYPVVIRIHPDASQRDVVEYVKEHWAEIKYYQDKYSSRNKGVSFKNSKTAENKKIRERNNFIYENRHLPRKKIMTMLTDRFNITLDYGHIGKIISLETKKRKKV